MKLSVQLPPLVTAGVIGVPTLVEAPATLPCTHGNPSPGRQPLRRPVAPGQRQRRCLRLLTVRSCRCSARSLVRCSRLPRSFREPPSSEAPRRVGDAAGWVCDGCRVWQRQRWIRHARIKTPESRVRWPRPATDVVIHREKGDRHEEDRRPKAGTVWLTSAARWL